MTSLMNTNVRDNIDAQGFGNRWDSSKVLDATGAYTYSAGPPIALVAPSTTTMGSSSSRNRIISIEQAKRRCTSFFFFRSEESEN